MNLFGLRPIESMGGENPAIKFTRSRRRGGSNIVRGHWAAWPLVAELLESRQLLAVITVNSVGDADGANRADTLSLRQAVEISNGTLAVSSLTTSQAGLVVGGLSTSNTIDFDIPGTGPFTITPTSPLPAITSSVVIDGYSEPGAHPNTNGPGQGKNTVLQIELDGAQAGPRAAGLDLKTGASTVQGLAIGGFSFFGLELESASDLVEGNFIGTDITGTRAIPNGVHGIYSSLGFGTSSTIGGTTAAAGNIISGNAVMGLVIGLSNLVEGNFIGTDITGTQPIPNGDNGLAATASDTIGGTTAAARNLVSSNTVDGLAIGDPVGQNNLVEGNFIGTDVTGTKPLPNGGNGINAEGSSSATIGGTTAGAGNLVSGNTGDGLLLLGPSSLVEGNLIGTNLTGTIALPNGGAGIGLAAYTSPFYGIANSSTIGGTTASARNVISGNTGGGIVLDNSDNMVEGNLIGTDITGTKPLFNADDGILVRSASNTIGGATAGAGNVIPDGLVISPDQNDLRTGDGQLFQTDNLVQGNLIGTDITGTKPLEGRGISADGVGDTIGGTTAASANLISGNIGVGLKITYSGPDDEGGLIDFGYDELVEGNLIGTDITRTRSLSNGGDGIEESGGNILPFPGGPNTIGGTAAGAGNVISGNAGNGVTLVGENNLVEGNLIGTNITGTKSLSNGGDGIEDNGLGSTIGGITAGARNIISGNLGDGLVINGYQGFASDSVPAALVEGNLIGTDITGTKPLPNGGDGIEDSAQSATIGGTTAAAGNVISGNHNRGIVLVGPVQGDANALVEGNLIGTDITGTRSLPNGGDGIDDVSAPSDNTIGGTTPGAGNIISGNQGSGIYLNADVGGDLIEGNFIGTGLAGTSSLPNGGDGIILDGFLNTIGGTAVGAGNVISGNSGTGLAIAGATNLVEGNSIGTNLTGTIPIPNGDDGIDIVDGGGDSLSGPMGAGRGGESNTIGGTVAGAGNRIADNTGNGISVYVGIEPQYQFVNMNGVLTPVLESYSVAPPESGQFNTISGNSIFANQNLGIELFNLHDSFLKTQGTSADYSLFTPAPGDPIGGNALLTAPTILSAVPDSVTSSLSGTLSGTPSSTLTVEFFADPSDNGQGQTYLGSTEVTTDVSGLASFDVNTGFDIGGQFITATATDSSGNTSQFSNDFFVLPSTITTLIGPSGSLTPGQPATFTAIVSQSTGSVPSGLVNFLDGGVVLATVPLDASGQATFVTTQLAPGLHAIAAAYLGDSTHSASLSNDVTADVQPSPTATTLIGPSGSLILGQPATFAAVVSSPGAGVATGQVAFLDDGIVIGYAPLNGSGVAVFITKSLSPGLETITAAYTGDPTQAASQSNAVALNVFAPLAFGGPSVTSVVATVTNRITITFNRGLLPGPAEDASNYAIVGPGHRSITVESASYDPSHDSVTLTTLQALTPGQSYELTINGEQGDRVADVFGIPLNGKKNGKPGHNFAGKFKVKKVPVVKVAHPAGPKLKVLSSASRKGH